MSNTKRLYGLMPDLDGRVENLLKSSGLPKETVEQELARFATYQAAFQDCAPTTFSVAT